MEHTLIFTKLLFVFSAQANFNEECSKNKIRSAAIFTILYKVNARQNGAHLRAMQIVLVTWAKQKHRVEVFFGNTKKLSQQVQLLIRNGYFVIVLVYFTYRKE